MSASIPTARERVCVLFPQSVQGRLEGGALKARLAGLRGSGCIHVVLNLEAVEEMDLLALGLLVEESRLFRQAAGRLAVVGMAPRLEETCSRLGALAGLERYASQEAALAALSDG